VVVQHRRPPVPSTVPPRRAHPRPLHRHGDDPLPSLFRSFLLGGFECATHRRRDGRRLDIVAASRHDLYAAADYARCRALGIRAVRDGIRWHRIETAPGRYDFSLELPRVRAARDAGVQVIWDLCHYGWPDDVDVFRPEFVERFAGFCRAFAELLADTGDDVPFFAPINEISFLAWAGGDVGYLNPFDCGRGPELKAQLVRAALAGIDALWSVDRRARIVHADPVIHITAHPERPDDVEAAELYRLAQFEAWDMLAGRRAPHLGGAPAYLDVVGVNFYCHNQWHHGAGPIDRAHPAYRPFRELLREVYDRYRRPLFVAETGIEGDLRADWLRYVGGEVRAALADGVPVEGICLYPIVNHPGWDDDRHCHNGLWDYADDGGGREIHMPLYHELRRQQHLHRRLRRRLRAAGRSTDSAAAG
jgi:polysaccharide biosynthesis protein PelF